MMPYSALVSAASSPNLFGGFRCLQLPNIICAAKFHNTMTTSSIKIMIITTRIKTLNPQLTRSKAVARTVSTANPTCIAERITDNVAKVKKKGAMYTFTKSVVLQYSWW